MTGYTKGPWVVRFSIGHNGLIRVWRVGPADIADSSHGGIVLYDDATSLNPHADGEQEANARLISAAPDMYEALKLVWEAVYDYCGPDSEELARVDAALAKAEGKA